MAREAGRLTARTGKDGEGIRISKEGSTYVPHSIAGRYFSFNGETVACETKTEIALVRLDERARHFPYSDAFIATILRVEAMATVRTDGIEPDLMQVLFLEAANRMGKDTPRERKAFLRKWFPASPIEVNEASYEALCALDALHYIMDYEPSDEGMQVEHLMDIYELCMRGTRREKSAKQRKFDEGVTEEAVGVAGVTYIAPTTNKIDSLMDDLMDFCNKDYLSPLTRSAVAHFQLEAIRPVNEGIDRLGRMLAFLLWRQSHLVENILPPFSVTPSVQTQKHTELLVPYKTKRGFEKRLAMAALDEWVAHCSRAARRSVDFAYQYMEGITALEKKWRMRIEGLHRNSALDTLLTELPGMPILTVADVSAITGKKFQTANECVTRLVQEGILVALTEGKRNRLFKAPEVIDMLKKISYKFFPQDAVPRENFFTVTELTKELNAEASASNANSSARSS